MNPLITAVEAAWVALKADILAAENWLWSVIKQLWAADVQIVMQDLNKALTNVAVQLQNEQPGIDSKQMFEQLLAAVAVQFASIGAQLVYEDITLVISMVIKQQNIPQTPGNAGNVNG